MKTNLSKQTKYFWKQWNSNKKIFELIEIPFNKENWFYVQIDATIRTTFLKYNFQLPSYVVVEKLEHYITFYIIRDKIKNKKELLEWSEKWLYVKSDLDIQARCNSTDLEDTENWIHFEFKII